MTPFTQEAAWRYVFDWAVAGEALGCAPGDRVLEYAGGSGYAGEWLNRLGYRTISVDQERELLSIARERLQLDQRVVRDRAVFTVADGMCLPFHEAVFDGVICLNALHHMTDYEAALAEIRRVLKPGCRAVFSEPGSLHGTSFIARLAMEEYGELERSIDLSEIFAVARKVGFERMLLKPFVYPQLVNLDYEDFAGFSVGRCVAAFSGPDQIAQFMKDKHAVFVLVTPGRRPVTSLRPNIMRAGITVAGLPASCTPGDELRCRAELLNVGDTHWLNEATAFGGNVCLGVKLLCVEGSALSSELVRLPLDRRVAPADKIALAVAFRIPWTLEPGRYILRFDLVAERIGWFMEFDSQVDDHPLHVTSPARPFTSAHPHVLGAKITLKEGPPPVVSQGERLTLHVAAENTGDTLWLRSSNTSVGSVHLGLKLMSSGGELLSDRVGRYLLPCDVPLGHAVSVTRSFWLPGALPSGDYVLVVDMVDEGIGWFHEFGSVPLKLQFSLLPLEGPPTSRTPRVLRAVMTVVGEAPTRVEPGQRLDLNVEVQNSGDTIWLKGPMDGGGFVTVGAKLIDVTGKTLPDELGHAMLPHDVAPGACASLPASFDLPAKLPDGQYTIRLDMVDEGFTWFGAQGSEVTDIHVIVER